MPLPKESITFSFTKSLDTFIDPNQLPIGKFVSLQNVTFVKTGSIANLDKRNGYANITVLDSQSSYLTNYSSGLIAISNQLMKSYSSAINRWSSVFPVNPLNLSVSPVIRNSNNQIGFDLSISNGLVCTVYLDGIAVSDGNLQTSTTQFAQTYAVSDINTGQIVLGPTQITSTLGTVSQTSAPRVFSIGSQFAIFSGIPNGNISSGSFGAIQYFTINQSTLAVSSANIITRAYTSSAVVSSSSANNGFDGVVSSNTLYFAWYAGSASGTSGLLATSFTNSLSQGSVVAQTQTRYPAFCLSLCADNNGPSPSRLWCTYTGWNGASSAVETFITDYNLSFISSTQFTTGLFYSNVTSFATNGTMSFFLERTTAIPSSPSQSPVFWRNTTRNQYNLNFGQGTQTFVSTSGLGIGSKPVVIGSDSYWVGAYGSTYQSTYFLINSASSVISKLSYGNGGGYALTDVPQMLSIGSSLFVGYLTKQTITGVNKLTAAGSATQTAGIYAQTGINLAKFNFNTNNINTIDTANNLHINGGIVQHYDGNVLDELNFNVYPDYINISPQAGLASNMTKQTYYYVATYEYTDNKGNIFRSAPAIPVSATLATASSYLAVSVPTYQITNKNLRNVHITLYRWSQNQQTYYQVTSESNPLANFNAAGARRAEITFIDTYGDSEILGNNIIYTNGGVLEDDAPPAANAIAMFDDRMWLVDAEDPNLLWFSKTIIEGGIPVEFSAFLTYFVPPTTVTGAQTGPVTAIAPMDDKLIIFKQQTIYYINGTGPDSTGANSQYSLAPIFVSSGVGCINQNSIVLTPMGLMFQSYTKGIWLLKRDLSVDFIGKEVEVYNSSNILSACLIVNSTQVRFTLDNGITLVYDYLVSDWGVNTNNGQSACLYQGLHTYLTNTGSVYQETPGQYLDGTVPVVMQFQTGFINPTTIQGYQRVYWMNILSNFISGNTYTMGIAYDYDTAIVQTATVKPTNTIGSGSQVESWQINFQRTQCQSFQLTFTEISSGTAGAGLTLSNINLVIGRKKTYPRNIKPSNRTG